jgi:hypothetical protein
MAEPIRVMTEPAPVEAISADELAYHRIVTFEARVAQAVTAQWTNHLATKYGLAAGDQILADGTIRRATDPPAG